MAKALNILILSTWSLNEPLTQSYLLPYLNIIRAILPEGSSIHLQTSEKERFLIPQEQVEEVTMMLKQNGITWLPLQYTPWRLVTLPRYFFQVLRLIHYVLSRKISVLHPFAPGAGVFAILLHLVMRRKIVFDSWEPHAESMVEAGTWARNSIAFRIQWWAEKQLAKRSAYLIAASERMPDYALAKWKIEARNVLYRPACVNLEIFDPQRFNKDEVRSALHLQDCLVCVYAGKLGGIYYDVEVLQFCRYALDHFGEHFRVLLVTETPASEIEEMCSHVKFPLDKLVLRRVAHRDIPPLLAAADFALTPVKIAPSKRYCTPVKDGEYWAMGLPVIIPPGISDDSEIVSSERSGIVINDFSRESCIKVFNKLEEMLDDPQTGYRCRNSARLHRNYEIAVNTYNRIYRSFT